VPARGDTERLLDSCPPSSHHRPVVLGGLPSQCFSIWRSACVHSVWVASTSRSNSALVGFLPPHVCGRDASALAYFATRFLSEYQHRHAWDWNFLPAHSRSILTSTNQQ
jgi:hypothetical protein